MKNYSFWGFALSLVFSYSGPALAQYIPDTGSISLFETSEEQRLETGNSESPERDYYVAQSGNGDSPFTDRLLPRDDVDDALGASSLRSRPSRGQFAFSPYVGTGFSIYGMAFEEDTFDQHFQIGEIEFIPMGMTRIDSHSQNFGDVFYPKLSLGGELAFGLSRHTEIYGGISYSFAEGRSFNAFSFSGPAEISDGGGMTSVDSGDEVRGMFTDYHSLYIGAGARRFFSPEKRLTPYASASFGVKFVNAIDLGLSLNDNELGNEDNEYANFFNQSTTFGLGLGVGFLYDVNDNFSIGLETGLHYSGGLSADDSSLSGGAQGLNDWSTDLSIPIMASARINFTPR